jgi:hypothetical protein
MMANLGGPMDAPVLGQEGGRSRGFADEGVVGICSSLEGWRRT